MASKKNMLLAARDAGVIRRVLKANPDMKAAWKKVKKSK